MRSAQAEDSIWEGIMLRLDTNDECIVTFIKMNSLLCFTFNVFLHVHIDSDEF